LLEFLLKYITKPFRLYSIQSCAWDDDS